MRSSLKKWASQVVLLLLVTTPAIAEPHPAAEKVVRLVTAAGSAGAVVGEAVLREAYSRLGYRVEVTRFPAERAIQLADQGRFDGEVQRIDGIGQRYTNLVQLYPSINHIEGGAFAARDDIHVSDWEDIRPYSCGIIRGWKFAERRTEGMDRYTVGGYNRLFTMLQHDRFDVAVAPIVGGTYYLKRGGFKGIVPAGPAIERFDVYHYLHRSKADLMPKIEAELERMRVNGELADIREKVIREILRRAEEGLDLCDGEFTCFESSVTES